MIELKSFTVACSTWKHVQVFCEPALRRGRLVTLKLPFEAAAGEDLVLQLRLPNDLNVDVTCRVRSVVGSSEGRCVARVQLVGLDDAVVARLGRMMAQDGVVVLDLAEDVAPLVLPNEADIPSESRDTYARLMGELESMRQRSAVDVLGLEGPFSDQDIDAAFRREVVRFHPDRFQSRDGLLAFLGRELVIELGRARAALMRTVGTPSASPHAGALLCKANIDDWHSNEAVSRRELAAVANLSMPSTVEAEDSEWVDVTETVAGENDGAAGAAPSSEVVVTVTVADEATELIQQGKISAARSKLAEAVKREPRNRAMRGLYHFAYGRELVERGEAVRATTQFETALLHDPECQPARRALDSLAGAGDATQSPLWKRLFGG